MTRTVPTLLAAAMIVGASTGAAFAVSGGPGGKGDGSTGSLGVQQLAEANAAHDYYGTVSPQVREAPKDGAARVYPDGAAASPASGDSVAVHGDSSVPRY